jgi:hypothetical protein
VQKQKTVTIATLSLSMSVLPTSVGANGLALVRWEALNATSCVLDPGGDALPTSGSRYILIPQTTSVTITARNAAGGIKQEQRTIIVDPSIQPNVTGKSVVGADGGAGRDGGIPYSMDGGEGGEGGDATLTGSLPPLDTSSRPARVMPITVIGGTGGRGGHAIPENEHGLSGKAGKGGRGGDVKLDVTLEASAGAPVQYIVQLRGGKGGEGGMGTSRKYPQPGPRGRDGIVTIKLK